MILRDAAHYRFSRPARLAAYLPPCRSGLPREVGSAVADTPSPGEDFHAKFLDLADRFKSLAKTPLPALPSTRGAWEPPQDGLILLHNKAIRDQQNKYHEAKEEAG